MSNWQIRYFKPIAVVFNPAGEPEIRAGWYAWKEQGDWKKVGYQRHDTWQQALDYVNMKIMESGHSQASITKDSENPRMTRIHGTWGEMHVVEGISGAFLIIGPHSEYIPWAATLPLAKVLMEIGQS